ncbi:MAG: CRTAC1 family protein, partial [Flavobacteriaceae bacterium]|nr:CRTAC1 family protein [Flavobacteriaceae bacterium]
RNDGNVFTDVSEEAGIYGGPNAYGLGVAVSDFNKDGYPDIYVGNDFHEDDYYYLNQGDGTFKESLKSYFGHISRFSMGNDVADINHDGWPDLISLDMLPEDEKTLKSSEGDDNIQTLQMRTQQYGYHYQYTRNMLFLNQEHGPFMETALLSGIAATDWSWSALIQDYNQDGEQDIFISNGIPKRPNDIDFIRFVSSDKIQNKINDTRLVDQKALELMPTGNVGNYIFQGTSSLKFIDQSEKWIPRDTLVSGATAYADFDADGDLDLVINNLNSEASVLENLTNSTNYLTIQLEQNGSNRHAIGAKVYVYQNDNLQYKELYTVRGFQASSEPILHFAFSQSGQVDSIRVIWPDNKVQNIGQTKLGQKLVIEKKEGLRTYDFRKDSDETNQLFVDRTDSLNFDYTHEEDRYIDFNRQKLMPFQAGDRGPALATGDWNGDGQTDIFLGGSKFKKSQLLIQNDTGFEVVETPSINKDSITEIVSATMHDFNNDRSSDLFIATGGADFFGQSQPLLDALITRENDSVIIRKIPGLYDNASVVRASDIDNDNDLDIFIGNHIVTNDYGNLPNSYMLINEGGDFKVSTENEFQGTGMITDAVFVDIDSDNDEDLLIVGEWMVPKLYINSNGVFELSEAIPANLNGLWQSVHPFD